MSKRATLVLAALVLVLLAYIFKYERTSLTSKELDQREGKVLTAFVRAKVDRLEVQRKGRRVVLARKPGADGDLGAWKVLEPWSGEADETEVDHVLGELEWLDARRVLSNLNAKDRAQFGLDKPRYRVTFHAGGSTQRLALGLDDVHGQGVYATVDDGATAFVVPKTLREALDHDPGHYRNKAFLGDMVTAWGRKLALHGDDGDVALEKKDGRWWVTSEGATFADEKAVQGLLRGLDDLRAVRFLEGAEAGRAGENLKHPARSVQLRIIPDEGREDKQPQWVELRLGAACPGHESERYASAGAAGAPVCVRDEDAGMFAPGPNELRQSRVLAAESSEIERFELVAGKTTLSLTRDGESWRAEGGKAVDREAVEQWLEAVGVERALAFPELAPLEERARLVAHLTDDRTRTIVVGDFSPDGSVLARRDDEPSLVRYRSALLDLLQPVALRFGSLDLWAHQPSEVVAFDARAGSLQRGLRLLKGAWRSDEQAPEVGDSLRVREVLRELARLRALSFVTSRVRPEHGLGAPRARLALSLAAVRGGSARQLVLEVGASTGRGGYARVDGGPTYEVPHEVVRLIGELAGAPRGPTLDAPAAEAPQEDEDDGHDHGRL